ncbi:MAG: hypothetical protein CL933_09620 [Deltaproteobacteria bacterium]|nr:hypothetical protein [Deltaproteobacteria bacterium]
MAARLIASFAMLSARGCAELAALDLPLPSLPGLSGLLLGESAIAADLREALEVGSGRASSNLSRLGGFPCQANYRRSQWFCAASA